MKHFINTPLTFFLASLILAVSFNISSIYAQSRYYEDDFNDVENALINHVQLGDVERVQEILRESSRHIDYTKQGSTYSDPPMTLLDYLLVYANNVGSIPILRILLEDANVSPEEALGYYVVSGDVEKVQEFFRESNLDPNYRRNEYDPPLLDHLLYTATGKGFIPIVRTLLENGANPVTVIQISFDVLRTPLTRAITSHNLEILDLFLSSDKFDVNAVIGSGNGKPIRTDYLLGEAIYSRNTEAIRRLLDAGVKTNTLSDDDRNKMLNLLRSYEASFHPKAR